MGNYMKTNILIPDKINVGYVKRGDTYTGQLGFVTYIDNKGQLRKEKSWNDWRNADLGNNIYDNTPVSGFVLNKKVGGDRCGWNPRQTYIRIYDPRGFEFEITTENLLYILDNTSCFAGKGLDGEFVYGWVNGQLLLISVKSPDYTKMLEFTDNVNSNNIKPKDLIKGATYINKQNKELVYLCKSPEYFQYLEERDDSTLVRLGIFKNNSIKPLPVIRKSKPKFWFCEISNGVVRTMATLSSIVALKDPHMSSEYEPMFDALQHNPKFSPIVFSEIEYRSIDIEYIRSELNKSKPKTIWIHCGKSHAILRISLHEDNSYSMSKLSYKAGNVLNVRNENKDDYFYTRMSLEKLFSLLDNPTQKIVYLENGKIKDEVIYCGKK